MKLTQSVSLLRSVTSNRLMQGCSLPPPCPPDSRDVIKLYSWLDLSYNFPFYLSVPYSVSSLQASLSCLSSWLFSRRSKVSREAKVRYLSGWILALKSIYDFPVFKCLFWVSPHSVSHCVLWPSSLLLLLPQCTPVFALSPAHNISEKFLNQSTIVSNLQHHHLSFSFFFPRHTCTHACEQGEWKPCSFSPSTPTASLLLTLSFSHSSNTLTYGRHYCHDSQSNSRPRQLHWATTKTQFAHDASACVCV